MHRASNREPQLLSSFESLATFDLYAGEGHCLEHATHDPMQGETHWPTGHFFALNLKSQSLFPLVLADLTGRKKEHDLHALKRQSVALLRQGVGKGRKVLWIWDKAGVFLRDKTLVHRMRSIAFAIFTPFYFIKAGLFVSLSALWTALGVIAVLLALKMITKFVGVWPLSRVFYMRSREANYTALLMSTGLTFGTISALFGLQNKIISQEQYSVLVTVVILSAFIPTLIAQKFFQPTLRTMNAWGRLYQRRINGKSPAAVIAAQPVGK